MMNQLALIHVDHYYRIVTHAALQPAAIRFAETKASMCWTPKFYGYGAYLDIQYKKID
mgnify:CR=1 FL=1